MTEAYRHDIHKLSDAGLQLRLPVDLVPSSQYSEFTNAITIIEGQLVARSGLLRLATFTSPIHTIHRLNQEVFSIPGNRIVGAGTGLYVSQLSVDPNSFRQLAVTLSGLPMVIVNFRFDLDEATWAIIVDGSNMWKFRDVDPSPSTFFFRVLGNLAPSVSASASDGGAGNLNSTGGTGYDWRYTYLDGDVRTESNPSPITMSGGSTVTVKPTAFTNPATVGDNAFSNPSSAYDGSTVTAAVGIAHTTGVSPGVTHDNSSCLWRGIANQTGVTAQTLYVDASIAALFDDNGFVAGSLSYSLDSGVTWNTFATTSQASLPRQVFSIGLPSAIPLGVVYIQAQVAANSLQGSTATMTASVFDIKVIATESPSVTQLSLVNKKANVCVFPSTNTAHTYIRLYRRGGSLTDAWRRVGEFAVSTLVQGGCGAGFLQIVDNISDAELSGDSILELDNDMPVTSVAVLNQPLTHIWGPSNSYLLGVGDPNRPESAYFSKPGNADAWPPENHVEVADPGTPLIAGLIFNTRNYAFSQEKMYELVFGLIPGVTFSPFTTPCKRGIIGKFAFCVYGQIYFCSKDGIYRTSGSEEESIVENDIKPLFPTKDGALGQAVNGYEAVDMSRGDSIRLEAHNDEIWFIYVGLTSQTKQLLIFDVAKSRWRSADYINPLNIVYSEPNTVSSMLAGDTTNLYSTGGATDNGPNIAVNVRTGAFDQGQPLNKKEYGDVIFDLDPGGGTVTITPFMDGDTVAGAPLVVSGSGRQQVPLSLSDVFAFNLSFNLAWTRGVNANPILYQLDILNRMEPVAVKHWEARESSFGMPGYFHVRDCYIALRSNATVILTATFDGIAQSYSIPSTSGQRRKIYVPLNSNKCKLCRLSLDSASQFQLYVGDIEMRVKPWLTVLGYQVVQAVGDEA